MESPSKAGTVNQDDTSWFVLDENVWYLVLPFIPFARDLLALRTTSAFLNHGVLQKLAFWNRCSRSCINPGTHDDVLMHQTPCSVCVGPNKELSQLLRRSALEDSRRLPVVARFLEKDHINCGTLFCTTVVLWLYRYCSPVVVFCAESLRGFTASCTVGGLVLMGHETGYVSLWNPYFTTQVGDGKPSNCDGHEKILPTHVNFLVPCPPALTVGAHKARDYALVGIQKWWVLAGHRSTAGYIGHMVVIEITTKVGSGDNIRVIWRMQQEPRRRDTGRHGFGVFGDDSDEEEDEFAPAVELPQHPGPTDMSMLVGVCWATLDDGNTDAAANGGGGGGGGGGGDGDASDEESGSSTGSSTTRAVGVFSCPDLQGDSQPLGDVSRANPTTVLRVWQEPRPDLAVIQEAWARRYPAVQWDDREEHPQWFNFMVVNSM